MSSDESNLDRESSIPFSRVYSSGEVIADKYRLESILGEGGMGLVWLARNEALDSRVALKLIRADFQNEEAAGRLLKEARAAARLEHRGIVRVFDFGKTALGDPFIVMELLDGRSFGAVLERHTRLSAVRAVQTMLPVIDALGFAHRHGIVHRDLKPDNIFLARQTKRTQPKVVDFGIAKMEQDEKRGLTRHGTVLGSPGYMSPEQARGANNVDHRADIWAVCVVLYEALTGICAFDGDNYNAMMRAIIEDHPTPITELAAGDDDLWRIMAQGLEKDPEQRWQNMRDLGKALAEWLLSRGVDRDITGEALEQVWMTEHDDSDRDVFSAQPPASEAAISIGRSLAEGPPTLATPKDGTAAVGRLSAPGVPHDLLSSRPPSTNSAVSIGPEQNKIARMTPWILWAGAAVVALLFVFVKTGDDAEAVSSPAVSTSPDEASRAPSQASEPESNGEEELTFETVDAGAEHRQGPAADEGQSDKPKDVEQAPAAPTPKAPTAQPPVQAWKPARKPAPRRVPRSRPAPRQRPKPPAPAPKEAPLLKDPYE